MFKFHLKKALALLLSAVMICSFAGCRKSAEKKSEGTTETTRKTRQNNPDYVKDDVVLPEDFGNMIYPMEALLIEDYSKGLPYYTEDSDEKDADSFWFSMAVLTSQMNHYVKDAAVESDDRYIYIDEETMNMYVSAMYDAFGSGNLEFPGLSEDNSYAVYDDDKGIYGFRQGTIGDLEPYITDCKSDGEEYTLTMHLKNKDSAEILASCDITLVPTSYESDENAFNYSVKDFERLESGDSEDFSERDTSDEASTTEDEDESTEYKKSDESAGSSDRVSRDKAEELAKEYFGDDAEYTFKKIVTIGDYDYYDFSVEGDDIDSTDVLVSVDGENVLGGTKNSDGTWSFDQ